MFRKGHNGHERFGHRFGSKESLNTESAERHEEKYRRASRANPSTP